MTLGLLAGETDWQAFRDAMPLDDFLGWRAYAQKNPQGTGHFYKFLGHAFVELAKAFHLKEHALGLRWMDFCWWVDPAEQAAAEDDSMSDDDMERYFDRFAGFGKPG